MVKTSSLLEGGGNGNGGGNERSTGSDVNKVMSRQQDKLYGFKNLSKSQEVISAALGNLSIFKRLLAHIFTKFQFSNS